MSVRWQQLRFSLALFISHIEVVWPTHVMRSGVTVCLESRGSPMRPYPWITAQPHRDLYSYYLLRIHLDCKSQALLTHLRCCSLRLMAITSVCFFSVEGRKTPTINFIIFFKRDEQSNWQLKQDWQSPLRSTGNYNFGTSSPSALQLHCNVKMGSWKKWKRPQGSDVNMFTFHLRLEYCVVRCKLILSLSDDIVGQAKIAQVQQLVK